MPWCIFICHVCNWKWAGLVFVYEVSNRVKGQFVNTRNSLLVRVRVWRTVCLWLCTCVCRLEVVGVCKRYFQCMCMHEGQILTESWWERICVCVRLRVCVYLCVKDIPMRLYKFTSWWQNRQWEIGLCRKSFYLSSIKNSCRERENIFDWLDHFKNKM